jgi:pyridoxal 5'-phosphate synthase pdxT subunit
MDQSYSKPIGILAIQGDFAAHQSMLRSLGVPTRLVKKAEELEDLAGLILPGGESTTLLKFLEQEALWEPLHAFAEEKPTLGTCAGAILMASKVENPDQKSLGVVDITVRRNAFGRQVFSFIRHATINKTFAEILGPKEIPSEGRIEAVFIRAPLILRSGSKVQELISLDGSPVLVQDGHRLAATFHPELSIDGPGAYLLHRYFCRLTYGVMPSLPTLLLSSL